MQLRRLSAFYWPIIGLQLVCGHLTWIIYGIHRQFLSDGELVPNVRFVRVRLTIGHLTTATALHMLCVVNYLLAVMN